MAKVLVTILNRQGETLERGEAASTINNAWWEYETTVPTDGQVIVEALDLAGNATRLEVTPTEKQQ